MTHTAIIGAGPGGLTAAYELARLGRSATVFEKDDIVGGISRTVHRDGYHFDIGGHRFFTKVPLIQQLWEEILGEEFLTRPRLSRIYYDDKFFHYPLKPANALRSLGLLEAVRIGTSYIRAQVVRHPEERNFEQWVSNRFGHRLFQIFFKTYTEKVWGMPCSEISADWAAQRIKNLDLVNAVKSALLGSPGRGKEVITTLIDQFQYPRLGPGMMWEKCRERLEASGIRTLMEARVESVRLDGNRAVSVAVRHADGRTEERAADSVISTMPLKELLFCLDPPPPPEVLAAAGRLRYRDFLTVILVVDRADVFPDNWIYIHSPDVKVGRVQNFKNWSPEMVPDASKTSLGLEYFVNENDELWSAPDDELIELGRREMAALRLIEVEEASGGWVVRMPKAYPVYDDVYQESVQTIRDHLDGIENLQTIGRNGQHRYNNQDHSMLTGVYAARNIAGASYDVWQVNVEQEYHEEVAEERPAAGDRLTPAPVEEATLEELVHWAFAQYDPVALGVALGSVVSFGLFLATAAVLFGPQPHGPTLSLLSHYFLGYEVSWGGALIGLVEGFIGGYALGWATAKAVNVLVQWYEMSIRRQLQLSRLLDPLETVEG